MLAQRLEVARPLARALGLVLDYGDHSRGTDLSVVSCNSTRDGLLGPRYAVQMTQAEILKVCMASATGAKKMMEIAGADSSPLSSICNSLALALVETAETVARQDPDASEASLDFILNSVMRYQTDLYVAIAVLTETRGLEARLRVAEAQLARRPDSLEARLRVVEAQLARRPDADADLH